MYNSDLCRKLLDLRDSILSLDYDNIFGRLLDLGDNDVAKELKPMVEDLYLESNNIQTVSRLLTTISIKLSYFPDYSFAYRSEVLSRVTSYSRSVCNLRPPLRYYNEKHRDAIKQILDSLTDACELIMLHLPDMPYDTLSESLKEIEDTLSKIFLNVNPGISSCKESIYNIIRNNEEMNESMVNDIEFYFINAVFYQLMSTGKSIKKTNKQLDMSEQEVMEKYLFPLRALSSKMTKREIAGFINPVLQNL